MAKAPPTRTEAEVEAAGKRVAVRITLKGRDPIELSIDDLGPADDLVARKQCGLPVTPFIEGESFGADSLLILWWMARRKEGEANLRFEDVLKEYPTYRDIEAAGFEIEAIEVDEDEDEEKDHPLRSDGA
jgi:hypothetical protein